MDICLRTSLLLICPAWSASMGLTQAANDEHQYGKIIRFLDGKTKKLPDIAIRFLGKRKVESPAFPRGFTYFDFEVTKAKETKKVAWSSGTGDIAPTFFDIGGDGYVLELAASDVLQGMLPEGEMVVWQRAAYDTKRIGKK
jgi:hypothetical protein